MKKLALLSVFCLLSVLCNAQSGTLDLTFNPTDINNNGRGASNGYNIFNAFASVFCSVKQPDGKIIIGGDFAKYNDINRNCLARLNEDGTLDYSLISNPSLTSISSIALQTDGKIIVTTSEGGIFRLNVDGTSDIFNSEAINGAIRSTSIQTDGKIIIGGEFTTCNGISRNRIARLNVDGTLDTSFNPGSGAAFGLSGSAIVVKSICMQPDGKIIIGGNFTAYNGVVVNHIARLNYDGSLDSSFNSGSGFGFNGSSDGIQINSILVQPDGKIIVGGNFTSFNGTNMNSLVRLNPNGTLDGGFNIGEGFNLLYVIFHVNSRTGLINSLALQADGKILVGGHFSRYINVWHKNIIRLNSDGSPDYTFLTGFGSGVDGNNYGYGKSDDIVYSLSLLNDENILINGTIGDYFQTGRGGVVKVTSSGNVDLSFNPTTGSNNTVNCSAIQPDNKIYIGGEFSTYNSVLSRGIVRLNTDGSVDTSFNTGEGFYAENLRYLIHSIAIQPDGKVIIGGDFTSYKGINKPYLIRLFSDGTIDNSFNFNIPLYNYPVKKIIIQPNGKILIGVEGNYDSQLIRLNSDGSQDTSFTANYISSLSRNNIVLQPDGRIIFYSNKVIRINSNGTDDPTFNKVLTNSNVHAICLQDNGKIIIVGDFGSVNNIQTGPIARLNIDGSLDVSFFSNSTLYYRFVAKIQSDGKLLVGGYTTSSKNAIERLNTDGSLDSTFNPNGTGTNGNSISEINIQNDGKILIGGLFTSYNGIIHKNIARLFATDDLATTNYNTIAPELKLFPNPANTFLTIETSKDFEMKNISVFNTLGQLVLAIPDAQKVRTIDVSGLVVGTYFMKINSDKGTVTRKFVKD